MGGKSEAMKGSALCEEPADEQFETPGVDPSTPMGQMIGEFAMGRRLRSIFYERMRVTVVMLDEEVYGPATDAIAIKHDADGTPLGSSWFKTGAQPVVAQEQEEPLQDGLHPVVALRVIDSPPDQQEEAALKKTGETVPVPPSSAVQIPAELGALVQTLAATILAAVQSLRPSVVQGVPPIALSIEDSAQYLGVSPGTIEYRLRNGDLAHALLGEKRTRTILIKDLIAFVEARRQQTADEVLEGKKKAKRNRK